MYYDYKLCFSTEGFSLFFKRRNSVKNSVEFMCLQNSNYLMIFYSCIYVHIYIVFKQGMTISSVLGAAQKMDLTQRHAAVIIYLISRLGRDKHN